MTTLDYSTLPSSIDEPVEAHAPSIVRSEIIKRNFSRRTLFKGVLVSLTALSLTALDVIAKRTGAYAATNWGDCPNWINRSDVTPDWTNCNPNGSSQGYIGGSYCGGDNFHLIGTINQGGGITKQYEQRDTSCTGKNAWAWYPNGVGPFPEPNAKRCSDGRVRSKDSATPYTSWHNSTCKHLF